MSTTSGLVGLDEAPPCSGGMPSGLKGSSALPVGRSTRSRTSRRRSRRASSLVYRTPGRTGRAQDFARSSRRSTDVRHSPSWRGQAAVRAGAAARAGGGRVDVLSASEGGAGEAVTAERRGDGLAWRGQCASERELPRVRAELYRLQRGGCRRSAGWSGVVSGGRAARGGAEARRRRAESRSRRWRGLRRAGCAARLGRDRPRGARSDEGRGLAAARSSSPTKYQAFSNIWPLFRTADRDTLVRAR
jgi:hypothetical protein